MVSLYVQGKEEMILAKTCIMKSLKCELRNTVPCFSLIPIEP